MSEVYRPSRTGDEIELKSLWKIVFEDDDDFLDTFFRHFHHPDSAFICEEGGRIVCAAHNIDLGELVFPGGRRDSLSIQYAFATLPECRGKGYGQKLMEKNIEHLIGQGIKYCALVPANRGLFDYYNTRTAYRTAFYAVKEVFQNIKPSGAARRLTPGEYKKLREELLKDRVHVDFTLNSLEFLAETSGEGGGFLAADAAGGVCCALVDTNGTQVEVKELLAPEKGFTI